VIENLIQAQGLNKSFGDTHAVNDVSLQIAMGEIYGLVGSDGAGKTTTLRLLVGALQIDGGEIKVGGYDVHKQVELARSQIGYLSQRFSLYEDLTVLENIRFSLKFAACLRRNGCLEVWKSWNLLAWLNLKTAMSGSFRVA